MTLTLLVAVGAVLLAVIGRALLVLEEITELLANEASANVHPAARKL